MTKLDSLFCANASVRDRTWIAKELPFVVPPEGVDPTVARIAAGRGVVDMDAYFSPSFKATMPDPYVLEGMEAATARIWQAVQDRQSIAILGDYDVDGASSTALMIRLLRMAGHEGPLHWDIPDRMVDGYGPNDRLIDELAQQAAPDLLILLDSGTASIGPVKHAREIGMDVIVIDHHEPQQELPDALIINPKCQQDRSLEHLCAAGLVFLFGVALRRFAREKSPDFAFPDIRSVLGLAALATIADVVPLTGLNRTYVSMGLPRMPEIVGLQALMDATGEEQLTVHGCGFVLAPCINAAGRIGTMHDGVNLLISESEEEAMTIASRLQSLNDERRDIQKAALEAAKAMVDETDRAIVLHDPSWHPGVVGLIASKLREAFDRPAIVIGEHGKGSARTVEGFDIGSVVIEATRKGLLLRGGGHKAAAGLTLSPDKFDDFKGFVMAALEGFTRPSFTADLVVAPGELPVQTAEAFKFMEPFGQGNPKPRIALVGGICIRTSVLKSVHVKIAVEGRHGITEAIAFNAVDTAVGKAMLSSHGRRIDLYGTVEASYYAGTSTVVLKPEDVMIGGETDSAAA